MQTNFIVGLRINEILPIGEAGNLAYRGAKAVRKPHLPGAQVSIFFAIHHKDTMNKP